MKYSMLILCVLVSTLLVIEAKKKFTEGSKKYEGDFEFAEDEKFSQQRKTSISERKKWIHDPSNNLCKPLNCKKKELCLLEDAYTAVCVSKKELHRNKDEVLTKNKYLEEEAKRKAEAVENGEENSSPQETTLTSNEESQLDDDIFYDSDADEQEENCKPCPVVKPIFLCGSDNKTYSSQCRLDYHNCLHATQIKVTCKGFCPCKDSINIKKQQRLEELAAKYKKTVDNNFDVMKKEKEDKKNRFISNSNESKYAFTPEAEDIKYDNKHYKYIKFTNGKRKTNQAALDMQQQMLRDDKRKVHIYNEVLEEQQTFKPTKGKFSTKQIECKQQQLNAIGNRLLDWFSVIMADSKKQRQHVQKSKARFPSSCKREAKWMFGHLDGNSDGYLSTQELFSLEHDKSEKCIKPYIDNCDLDQNSVVNAREWCRCFEKADRPCAAVRRRLSGEMISSYSPDCDELGFYRPVQCHKTVGVCWCVDKHGVEFANTRTRDKPNCADETITNAVKTVTSDDEDSEDDATEEGSADKLLVF